MAQCWRPEEPRGVSPLPPGTRPQVALARALKNLQVARDFWISGIYDDAQLLQGAEPFIAGTGPVVCILPMVSEMNVRWTDYLGLGVALLHSPLSTLHISALLVTDYRKPT